MKPPDPRATTERRKTLAIELSRVFKFALLGGLATLLHMALAVGLTLTFEISPYFSNLLAFLAAFIASFAGHRYVTFAGMESRLLASMRAFFVVAATGFLANNMVLVWLLEQRIVDDIAALLIAALIIPAFTFLAARFWAFGSRR